MPLANDDMKASRYLRWHNARKRLNAIRAHLEAGRIVQVTTYLRATRYKSQHAEMFRATRQGLFVQRGKSWDSLNFTTLHVFEKRGKDCACVGVLRDDNSAAIIASRNTQSEA